MRVTQIQSIPKKARDKSDILESMQMMRGKDADWKNGRVWSLVYYAGDEYYEFLKQAHNTFFSENGLNPMAFQSLKQMESEVVRMTANMLHGDGNTVGTMTSGGTESLLMAVKAARDRAASGFSFRDFTPEIVAPASVHVAVEKAAHYFGMKIRYAPLRDDFRVDIKAMKKLINKNTVLLVASAPQYAHGVIDPIEEIGQIAQQAKIPFHVDACFGGFVLPWIEKLGYALPKWDFRVPGVTSISADLHKYGYSAKGASTIIYRDMSYLKHQFFVCTDSPLGIYASPSMPGTRPGGPISAAWAALQALGEEGYVELTRKTMDTVGILKQGVSKIPGLKLLGDENTTVVCIASNHPDIDIYAVADQLDNRGWSLDRQQKPASLHCTVTANHQDYVDDFLTDLAEAAAFVKANPDVRKEGQAPMYGMIAKIPFRGAVKYSVLKVMEGMYSPGGSAPDLGSLGEGEEDGPLFKLMNRYGDQALRLLEEPGAVVKDAVKEAAKILGIR